MAEKDKNNFVVNDKTYVKKPEIHYSYKFQPYVKDLGGSPGKNITQEDRNKRQKHENNVNAVRNVIKGLNNTFGKAISGATAFYGGGWALNRLLHLNKPSTLGQFFGRYVLPANTADNVSDGVELIFDPSVEGAVDLGSGVVLGRFKDLSKPVRQVGELIGQGANINNMKKGGKMNILEFLKNGSGIHIKKKNRGKFTSYCGGKVTDECIRKAKASGNPTLVKRATFAANARKWKHKEGGIIKSQEGSKVNWGELAVNSGTNLLSAISKDKQISYNAQAKKAQNQIDYNQFIQDAVNNAIQKMNETRDQWRQSYLNGDTLDRSFESDVVMGNLQHQFMAPEIAKGKQALNNTNAQVDAEAKAQKGDNWSNMFGNVVQTRLGDLGNYLGQKKTTTPSIPQINSQINESGYNQFTKNSLLYL